MPKAPDWLMNISATAPNLIEDTPVHRAEEQATQANNLAQAADQAGKMLREKTQQMQLEHVDAMKAATERIQAQTQAKRAQQLADQQERLRTTQEMTQRVQQATLDKKNEQNVATQQQHDALLHSTNQLDSLATDTPGTFPPGFYPGEDASAPMDEGQAVLQLSRNLGLSPQVVASMVLVGNDMERLDREGKLQKEPWPWAQDQGAQQQQVLANAAAVSTPPPVPLEGPPTDVASPGTPPDAPQPEPQPTPMVPPGQPTPY
jgi:chemotaxis protein histidine kinase CheA